MSNFTSSPILSEYTIQINNVLDADLNIFPEEPDMNFGILTLKTVKTRMSKTPILFKFDIDASASMSESGGKGISKMEYVKSTFANMMIFLAEQTDIQIYLQVGVFNSNYANLIDTILITQENHLQLIEKVKNISPSTCTNIEKTFKESTKIITEHSEKYPETKIAYVLLTDGVATEGNQRSEYLASIVPKGCEVFCIGYGKDHCAKLLHACGEYYFINDFEITGKVYGEIVFAILYLAVIDVEILMENGAKIYDAFTNQWTTTLMIPKIYGDKEVTYAIKCPKDIDGSAVITGTIVGEPDVMLEPGELVESIITTDPVQLCVVDQLPDLLEEDGSILPVDLRKYMYRQATQQFLYECLKLYSSNQNILDNRDKIKKYEEDIQAFYRKMKKFMTDNNLQDDVFMKVLCDDVYTSYKTVGRESSATFTVMRQRAHAREMSYRAGTDELNEYDQRHQYVDTGFGGGIGRQCSITRDYGDQDEYFDEEYQDINETQVVDYMRNADDPDNLQRYVSATQRDDEYCTSRTMTQTIRGVSGV
jgi:hypothetical protein